MRLGTLIRQRRSAAGLSQVDVAAGLGMGRSHYTRIENGQKPISVIRLLEICNILGGGAAELIQQLETLELNNEN